MKLVRRTPQHEADLKRMREETKEDRIDLLIFLIGMVTTVLFAIVVWQAWF